VALERKNNYKSHIFFLFLSGLIILIFSALIYLLIIRNVYGRFTTAHLIPSFDALTDLLFGTPPQAAILNSQYTKNILAGDSKWFTDNLNTWQKSLKTIDMKYVIIEDENIELGKLSNYKLIILPGCKSLSEREIIQLKIYLENGGSVFATGGTASYSEDGKWRGWDFLSDVFGINFRKQIGNEDKTKIHTLRGGLPITANIPSGFPLSIATWDHPIAAEVMDPRTTQVSFWYNYRLENGLVREGIKESAGIVHGNYGKGRFVWMGFEVNSILGLQDDYIYFDRLFKNSISWLTYKPIAYLRNWPNGFRGAAVIVPIISDSVHNVYNLFPVLDKNKIKATFFIRPEFAQNDQLLINNIQKYGEVGLFVDVANEKNISDKKKRFEQFTSGKKILEKITGKEVEGLYPVFNASDESNIRTLIDNKFKYFISDSLGDMSVPKTIKRKNERLISISSTARDDYEVIRDFNLTEKEFQIYSYQEDIDRVAFEGGLYLFKIHMDYQCSAQYVQVVGDLVEDIKSKDYWIATLSEIAQWSNKKEYIELRTQRLGDTRVVVTITNPGNFSINYLVIDVDLNEKAANVTLETEIIGTKMAEFKHADGSQFVNLYIDELRSDESRTYYIDYDKINY
jgi:peptidoglycan/xylan/chitin deacetylase (PgdA/CDA1 family)